MVEFYGEVLGLDRIDDPPGGTSAFSRVAEGVAGHTQVLVLFDRSPDAARTTVDHVAFGVQPDAFDAEAERLTALGYDLAFASHDWVAWRSLYLSAPDGNHVELVCHAPPLAWRRGAGRPGAADRFRAPREGLSTTEGKPRTRHVE